MARLDTIAQEKGFDGVASREAVSLLHSFVLLHGVHGQPPCEPASPLLNALGKRISVLASQLEPYELSSAVITLGKLVRVFDFDDQVAKCN
eukprot:3465155-Amphidinium_carterae.1